MKISLWQFSGIKTMVLCDLYEIKIVKIKLDIWTVFSSHSCVKLRNRSGLFPKQLKSAISDDYDHRYHTFQGCSFQDI